MDTAVARGEKIKVLANEAFKSHKYSQAIDLYTQAIELNGQNAVYWANRAFAHTKLEEYGSAIQDATKAIEVDPRYSKGYYRRGAAYLSMGKFKEALKDFQQVKKICPNDPDATKKLKECEKAAMKLKFEEAIAVQHAERRSIADSIDFHSIEVEPQYTGARIEGDIITLNFVKKMLDDFKNQKFLHRRYAYQIVLQTREILRALPSLVDINVTNGNHFTVCGDVHGQGLSQSMNGINKFDVVPELVEAERTAEVAVFDGRNVAEDGVGYVLGFSGLWFFGLLFYDLLNIFELNGLPSEENPYLFNGDFVDRGSFSLEVILTLFAFICMSPSAIYLSRGNHESKSMNKIYGFEGEVKSKLSDAFVELFAEVFCFLPLAHVLNGKVFVVHGGLFSVDGVKLSDIRAIDRFCEPPEEGLMCELLWSDPQPTPGRGPSKRGVGLSFGKDVTKRFLEDNKLGSSEFTAIPVTLPYLLSTYWLFNTHLVLTDLLVRSHEVKDEGYEIEHDGKLITVFSAPNYCDQIWKRDIFGETKKIIEMARKNLEEVQITIENNGDFSEDLMKKEKEHKEVSNEAAASGGLEVFPRCKNLLVSHLIFADDLLICLKANDPIVEIVCKFSKSLLGYLVLKMGNKGAFIRFRAPDMKPNIVTFSAVPHPDVKPMAYANNFLQMFN
ncbi:hypothetical protein GIB67_039802 [Kingdonia uniflora]|uniref:protein-serine/threonine phosphatase n=2 Tax=Magnoliopsida TaxID=3398 RepID=A0A7J7P344_9MAGN|nr:hypothetical protein GIB67_039802 [Kingdonia uniflora]